jgi:hypothetical protein
VSTILYLLNIVILAKRKYSGMYAGARVLTRTTYFILYEDIHHLYIGPSYDSRVKVVMDIRRN